MLANCLKSKIIRFFDIDVDKRIAGGRIPIYIFLIMVLAIIFWQTCPIYTFDSCWYIGYVDYFTGDRIITDWNPVRGFTFPLLLWLARNICIGDTGVKILLIFLYMIFCYSSLLLFKMIKKEIKHEGIKARDFMILTVFLYLNPIIWGYFHTVLTDGICLSFIMLFCYFSTRYYIYRLRYNDDKNVIIALVYAVFSMFLIIVLWNLKQCFFWVVLSIGTCFEILLMRKKKSLYQYTYTVLYILSLIVVLIFSIRVWNNIIDNNDTRYQSGLVNNIIKIRYFPLVGDDGDYTVVNVVNDEYEVVDTFEYKFDAGVINKINFLWECFKRYPSRVIQGYCDNYMIIAELFQNPLPQEGPPSYIYNRALRDNIIRTITNSDGNNVSAENRAIVKERLVGCDNVANINYNIEGLKSIDCAIEKLDEYGSVSPKNFITVMLSNDILWNVWQALFSLTILLSPFIFVISFIKSIRMNGLIFDIIFAYSVFSFGLIVLYTVAAEPIDRYAIPSFGMILFTCLLFSTNKRME